MKNDFSDINLSSKKFQDNIKRSTFYPPSPQKNRSSKYRMKTKKKVIKNFYIAIFLEIIKQIIIEAIFKYNVIQMGMPRSFKKIQNMVARNSRYSQNVVNITQESVVKHGVVNSRHSHQEMFHEASQYLMSFKPVKIANKKFVLNKNLITRNSNKVFEMKQRLKFNYNSYKFDKLNIKSHQLHCSNKKAIKIIQKMFYPSTMGGYKVVINAEIKNENNIKNHFFQQVNNNVSKPESNMGDDEDSEQVLGTNEFQTSNISESLKKINYEEVTLRKSNITSVLYVEGCSLWKFPPWLVERLDLVQIVQDISTLSIERYRSTLMRQLKSTATDLLLFQTVRREFLRTILVIELNNIVKLMEHVEKLGLDMNLKNDFFQHLRPIVCALDNPDKEYMPEMEEMAYIIDKLYLLIAPAHVIKGNLSYKFNVVYCSYLISHWAIIFNEKSAGGIVDNNLFANESKYFCMVMVTPQVIDKPIKSDSTKVNSSNFRVETYFDVERGLFSGYELDFTKSFDQKYVSSNVLECLIYSYLTRESHWVEDKSIFLLNGPAVKGNLDFTKIYYALLKGTSL